MLLLAAGFAKPGSKGEKGQFTDEIELHESAEDCWGNSKQRRQFQGRRQSARLSTPNQWLLATTDILPPPETTPLAAEAPS